VAEITVTLDAPRQAAVDTVAANKGITVAEVAQESADFNADLLRIDIVTAWWNLQSLDEKEAFMNA
tara:strand:- start:16 stop:213 length:198 start_codon:yes stop_codon:yes gene_type:complete